MASKYSVAFSHPAQVVLSHLPCSVERAFRLHVEQLAEAAAIAGARFPLLGCKPVRLDVGGFRFHCAVDHASRTVRVYALVHRADSAAVEFGREIFLPPPAYRV